MDNTRLIYLDYAAAAPLAPEVKSEMLEWLGVEDGFANPSSRSHKAGWFAGQAVEAARAEVAATLACSPLELIWTSGATEANNLAIKGLVHLRLKNAESPVHIITSKVEHSAVLKTCQFLAADPRVQLTLLSPEPNGQIALKTLQQALQPNTILVSLMHVNNELGSINPIADFAKACRENPVTGLPTLLHVDAAQSIGKLAVPLDQWQADAVSFSAHKAYGPKGVGVLYLRRDSQFEIEPLFHGGLQEKGLRSGTLATHQIVGMAKAFALAKQMLQQDCVHAASLRQLLLDQLSSSLKVQCHTDTNNSVAGILNIGVTGIESETLSLALPQLAFSSGSACNSVTLEPSYVLTACGLSRAVASSSIRLSYGRYTTRQQVSSAADLLLKVITGLA